MRGHRARAAIDTARQVTALAAGHSAALVQCGLICIDAGGYDGAAAALEQAAAREPHSATPLVFLALAQSDAGRFDDAGCTLERAIALEPRNRLLHTCTALNQLRRGRAAEAVASLDEHGMGDSTAIQARIALHIEELLRERIEDTEAGPPAAERSEPRSGAEARRAHKLVSTAEHLLTCGRTEEALDQLQRAAEICPDADGLPSCMGRTLFHLERYRAALAQLESAVAQKPDGATHLYLGATLYFLGDFDRALEEIGRAADMPEPPENSLIFRLCRGLLLLLRGRARDGWQVWSMRTDTVDVFDYEHWVDYYRGLILYARDRDPVAWRLLMPVVDIYWDYIEERFGKAKARLAQGTS